MNPKIGQKVTVKEPIEACYSAYAGNPKVVIHPGQIGIVQAIKVPSVHREGVCFNCVDFDLPGVFNGGPRHKNITWRIAARNEQLKKPEGNKETGR